MAEQRSALVERETRETSVRVQLDLDGSGRWQIATGVAFLDHMLSHVAAHSLIDLEIACQGDLEVDAHHSVEDVGIAMGQALARALGDKVGIVRYGSHTLPMDEALALVSLDLSGRGLLVYHVDIPTAQVGTFDTELVPEFLRALAHNAGITLHVRLLDGANSHHIIEAIFKALGRALGQAVARDERRIGVASTKGTL
ncbi:MAG: imidazoleglycerol-phosphate dehydratase HisB [Anaerolineae bacterium]|jgi:imidazoleglycerol-phosphate dehydratase